MTWLPAADGSAARRVRGLPWTPEQALAVFALFDDLRERIWKLYNIQLQDLLREQQQSPGLDDSDDTLPPTQSAPFI
jgi:hypothetical protein